MRGTLLPTVYIGNQGSPHPEVAIGVFKARVTLKIDYASSSTSTVTLDIFFTLSVVIRYCSRTSFLGAGELFGGLSSLVPRKEVGLGTRAIRYSKGGLCI